MASLHWDFSVSGPVSDPKDAGFVGLRHEGNAAVLYLPHGVSTAVPHDQRPARLGLVVRLLSRYAELQLRHTPTTRGDRDGPAQGRGQSHAWSASGPQSGFHQAFAYVQLIRLLQRAGTLSIGKERRWNSEFDHRHLSASLERALLLPDGVAVLDQTLGPATVMRRQPQALVGLACWLALDGLQHLFPTPAAGTWDDRPHRTVIAEWQGLADRFAERQGLTRSASLFGDFQSIRRCLAQLQAALKACVASDPPVSSEARSLHEAVQALLHHRTGDAAGPWLGLQTFHQVWEAACLDHAIDAFGASAVVTCDTAHLDRRFDSHRAQWDEAQQRLFTFAGHSRRPDLVVRTQKGWRIIDFKYYAAAEARERFSTHPPSPDLSLVYSKDERDRSAFAKVSKPYQDVVNMSCYRWLLKERGGPPGPRAGDRIDCEFWLAGHGQTEDRNSRPWMSDLALTLVEQPAAQLLERYASGWRL